MRRSAINGPEVRTFSPQLEVEEQRLGIEEEVRVVIVGAGGYGRVALDVLLAGGFENQILGFYDDARATLPQKIRGIPIVGDVSMLKSMLSIESASVIVAITDAVARLKVANSIRSLGGNFFKAEHPLSYVSQAATVGDGSVLSPGAVVHPDAFIGSHSFIGPGAVVDRDAEVGAGAWISAGAVVGVGAVVGAKVVLGNNASVERKATVEGRAIVEANTSVRRSGTK